MVGHVTQGGGRKPGCGLAHDFQFGNLQGPVQDLGFLRLLPFQMPVAVGPYGQTQPSCFDRVKMGFMMGFAVGMAAGAMFGTFSCLR